MNDSQNAICPWCQTEIVWDEELGPEEQCPHCLNELSDYRSVNVLGTDDENGAYVDEEEDEDEVTVESPVESSASTALGSDDLYTISSYEAASRHLMDRQDVYTDCGVCGVEMLHMGTLEPAGLAKLPEGMSELQPPLLGGKLELDAFVCPTCFRVETKLTDLARMKFVQQLTDLGNPDH